jgi:hypothetical protein
MTALAVSNLSGAIVREHLITRIDFNFHRAGAPDALDGLLFHQRATTLRVCATLAGDASGVI